MNFDNFFKNMWRFSESDPSQEPRQFPEGDEDETQNLDPFQEHFRSFQDETEEMRKHFERQFEFIFKSFGFMDFGGNFENNSFIERPPNAPLRDSFFKDDDQMPKTPMLRDKLLKEPDSEKQTISIPKGGPRYERPQGWFSSLFNRRPLVDEDLDEDVLSQGIDHLLKQPPVMEPKVESRSFYSKTAVTIMSPDGKIEQRYSERDEYGNKKTVVKRQLGDKEHCITIKKDDKGVVQEENFINLDDRNLKDFNEEWNTNERQFHPDDRRDYFPIRDPSAPGIYQRLFGNILPSPKDKN